MKNKEFPVFRTASELRSRNGYRAGLGMFVLFVAGCFTSAMYDRKNTDPVLQIDQPAEVVVAVPGSSYYNPTTFSSEFKLPTITFEQEGNRFTVNTSSEALDQALKVIATRDPKDKTVDSPRELLG